jgi:hypothetical protein
MDRIRTTSTDNTNMMYLLIFILVVGTIVFFYWINPKRKLVENSKNLYNVSVEKMNKTYGTQKKDAETAATDAKESWDRNVIAIYKIIIEFLLFLILIVFNLYNPFSNMQNNLTATMIANGMILVMMLFEYFTDVFDTFFKDSLHSIESKTQTNETELSPELKDNYQNKLLVLMNTVSIGIFAILYMIWYRDNLFIVYAAIAYILSLFTIYDVPGFASEFYIFLLYYILNIPMVTMTVAHLNINVPTTTNGVYIPLLIAFYILTIIALATLGIVDLTNTHNVFTILGLIGLSFLYHAQTLTSSIYKTFVMILASIMLFIVLVHYIVMEHNWILYMTVYAVIIGTIIYASPKPDPSRIMSKIKPLDVTKEEIGLIIGELIFILGFIYTRTVAQKIYTKHGILIVNNPISIHEYNNVTVKEKPTYDYGISFWIFIKPMNPGAAPQATDFTTVLSYGGKPRISYNGYLNTIRVEIKTDAKKNIKLEDVEHVPLQKWNHMVINYVNGTCDIFMNGVLQSSTPDIIPIKESDSVQIGDVDGIQGSICNVILFTEQLTSPGITNLYEQFSEKNPPTI